MLGGRSCFGKNLNGVCMFFPDLSKDCQVCSGEGVRAVGWLARGKPYTQGGIQPEHLSAHKHHVATAYQPFPFRGFHECELTRCFLIAGRTARCREAGQCHQATL